MLISLTFLCFFTLQEDWNNIATLIEIRNQCQLGRDEWKYSEDQLDYHYYRQYNQVLHRVIDSRRKQEAS
jgi:hypothetical protein